MRRPSCPRGGAGGPPTVPPFPILTHVQDKAAGAADRAGAAAQDVKGRAGAAAQEAKGAVRERAGAARAEAGT